MNRLAQCSCGQLKAKTDTEPQAVVMCHCLECQRRTGSVFAVGAYFEPRQVQISGESRIFTRLCNSGETFESMFCPHCGTSLFWRIKEEADSRIGIAVGAFADLDFPKPVRSVWEQSQHTWVDTKMIADHYKNGRL